MELTTAATRSKHTEIQQFTLSSINRDILNHIMTHIQHAFKPRLAKIKVTFCRSSITEFDPLIR